MSKLTDKVTSDEELLAALPQTLSRYSVTHYSVQIVTEHATITTIISAAGLDPDDEDAIFQAALKHLRDSDGIGLTDVRVNDFEIGSVWT